MNADEKPGNGHSVPVPAPDDGRPGEQERMIAAMEEQHDFPGFYKVVVIAEAGDAFHAALRQMVEVIQAEAPFRIGRRDSSRGGYVAYHLEIHVDSARTALERKHLIARLEGVRVML